MISTEGCLCFSVPVLAAANTARPKTEEELAVVIVTALREAAGAEPPPSAAEVFDRAIYGDLEAAAAVEEWLGSDDPKLAALVALGSVGAAEIDPALASLAALETASVRDDR